MPWSWSEGAGFTDGVVRTEEQIIQLHELLQAIRNPEEGGEEGGSQGSSA